MARTAEQVADQGIATYRERQDFSGGVGTERTHVLAMLELHPRVGLGALGAGVRRRASRRGISAARRVARREASLLSPRGRRRRLRAGGRSLSLAVNGQGVLTSRQVVQPTNISDFYDRARRAIIAIQTAFTNEYRRSARKDTNKESRGGKIRRLVLAAIQMIRLIVPGARAALRALEVVSAVGNPIVAVLDAVLGVMEVAKAFLTAALMTCQSAVLTGAFEGTCRVVVWINEVKASYEATVGRLTAALEQIVLIGTDIVSLLTDFIAGTLIGRIVAALADPVSFALERINEWIQARLADIGDVIIRHGGAALGALICGYEDFLDGRISLPGVVRSSFSDIAAGSAASAGPSGTQAFPSLPDPTTLSPQQVVDVINQIIEGFIRLDNFSLEEFLDAFTGRARAASVARINELLQEAIGEALFYRFASVILARILPT